MSDSSHSRYLIVGGGSMGLATADWLAASGAHDVRVLDAHRPPHDQGAHHGETRLIRLAYGEGGGYVALALRALERWRQLEQDTGESLFLPTGVINLGPESAPFLRQVVASARAHDLALETLDAAAVQARWPGWRPGTDHQGAFEAAAGVLRVDRIMSSWRRRVEAQAGIAVVDDARVVALRSVDGGFEARCADGRCFRAERVMLSAGQHLAGLLAPLGVALPLVRVRKTFAWFDADARYSPARFPGFSLVDRSLGDYYGFPDIDGAGFKIGRHDGGQPLAPGEAMREFGEHEEDRAELQRVIDRYLPGVGVLRRGAVCQYIRTPDEHFLIDEPLPGLIVAGGFSGHGFKFASALGEALGEWLVEGRRRPALAAFSADRFEADV